MKRLYLLAPLSLSLFSCAGPARREPTEPAPVSVQTVAVQQDNWPAGYEATGSVKARLSATISSKLMASVERVFVEPGDRVKQGQVLVLLDPRDSDAEVLRTEAVRAEANSGVAEAANGVLAAKANLDLAQVTFERIQRLASQRSVTKQELDEATEKRAAAQATYDMALARQREVESRVKASEQSVAAAKLVRDRSSILAPFAGVVVAKSVQAGDLAMPGSPLISIESPTGYRLEVNVDESRGAAVRLGGELPVSIDGASCEGPARASEIVPLVDPASRSYLVKLDLPLSCQGLRSGMFGRATLNQGHRAVIVIPQPALVEHGQLRSVFTAEAGHARERLITVGSRRGAMLEVLSGLEPGERIVSPVPPNLTDGAPVDVSNRR